MSSSTPEEYRHYTAPLSTPDLRIAACTRFPEQILGARQVLERLEREVPEKLGGKRALLTWGMKDYIFSSPDRAQGAFTDVEVVELPNAGHYFIHDASAEVAEAIAMRFPA